MGRQLDGGLGTSLRRLRQAAGLTQEELAERSGISARTVSDVERGLRTVVHADTARRLTSALEVEGEQRRAFEALARGRGAPEPVIPLAGRLPEQPTQLIGRSREVGVIGAVLVRQEVRLLTLTGPGGIGKTRLAVEVARRTKGSFAAGVFFVSLGEVKDASLVVLEMAKALGVVETSGDLPALMARHLAGRRALVVLDTFEHLLAAAPLLYDLVLHSPVVTFLVTSRSALRLRGEHEFPVPPLELPSDVDGASSEQLLGWPATALFWDRARAVRPDLELDPQAAREVAGICRKLDGLPLAIELAAARVRHLPLSGIREQLDDRLRLLVGGPVDLPRRQRAMRDTMAWSHDLLGPGEAKLFRRLAVFSGGWDLEAAKQVCGGDEVGGALERVSALVDQSLVLLDPDHPDGRYQMLDVVSEYAAHRLSEAGETEEIRRRHALHFLALSEEAEPNLVREGQEPWFRRLDRERGNLRRGMAWTIEREETILALRYAAALWRYWRQRGELVEGRRWSEAALRVLGEAPASLRAKALGAAAALAWPQGDYLRLAELASEGIELALQSDDPMDLRNAVTFQGFVAMGQGRYEDALASFSRCVDICRALGSSWQLATSHLNLGVALLHLGRPTEADGIFEEARRLYRELGDAVFTARVVNQRAQCALARHDIEQAEALAREALAGFAEHQERQGIAEGLETLAAVAAARSDGDRAATLGGASAALRETIAAARLPDLVIAARMMQAAERAAGERRWRIAWEAGRTMGTEAALAHALGP